jgi:hypothetical protein
MIGWFNGGTGRRIDSGTDYNAVPRCKVEPNMQCDVVLHRFSRRRVFAASTRAV